jgi:hypothetical protein
MNTSKPRVVFCHGIWADGSSFSKVIPLLQAEGYEVMAAQHGLDTPECRRHGKTDARAGRQPHYCRPVVPRKRHYSRRNR